jgi:hypothetical protein
VRTHAESFDEDAGTFCLCKHDHIVQAKNRDEQEALSGRVTDVSGAVIVGAQCTITDLDTNVSASTTTNEDGIYVIPALSGHLSANHRKEGFRTVVQHSFQLYAQDAINENCQEVCTPSHIGMKSICRCFRRSSISIRAFS